MKWEVAEVASYCRHTDLHTLIAVVDVRHTIRQCPPQRRQRQFPIQRAAQIPATHRPCMHVHDDRQVDESRSRRM